MLVTTIDQQANIARLAVLNLEDGAFTQVFDPDRAWDVRQLQVAPDGGSIVYGRTEGGVSNLWSMPIGGGEPRQLTAFTSDIIFSFAYSPDGTRLAMARGSTASDVVLISNYR